MDLRTIKDRVILAVEFNESLSASGIYLGEGEVRNEAVVVAVGPKVLDVTVGTRVLMSPEVGLKVTVGRRRLLVQREADLLAVLEP